MCLYTHRLVRLIVQDEALQRARLLRRPFYLCVCVVGGGSLGDMDRPLSVWGYVLVLGPN